MRSGREMGGGQDREKSLNQNFEFGMPIDAHKVIGIDTAKHFQQ